jgi:formylglycine-generating enzyme required for sulfatase activity
VGIIKTKFFAMLPAILPLVMGAEVQSQTISLHGGNATLTWNASSTGPVNVQRSGNLTTWAVVSEGNSNGTYTEAVGNSTKAFYRLSSFVFVEGNSTIASLLVANTETTWGEWKRVRAWAVANGYSFGSGNATGTSDRQPVHSMDWYDALKWCNARSEMEGLVPVYSVNSTVYRSGQSVPTPNLSASGYRLPSEVEWERAAKGGIRSQGTIYSGSNDVNLVAWYNNNSSSGPKPVGTKAGNELAIFDMSGNVLEWCWDSGETSGWRVLKGGFWNGGASGCLINAYFEQVPNTRDQDSGFRVVRKP